MTTTLEKPPAKTSRGLGKGLSALMGEASYESPKASPRERERASEREATRPEGVVSSLPIDDIVPGKYQPRNHFDPIAITELADSLRRNGLLQPLVVRSIKGGKYEIIAGERRWRAAGIAGMREVPVIVRVLDDKQALESALIENIQREDLNPLEEAAGYQRLMFEFDYTQEELSNVVHKSRSHVTNLLRLIELPDEIRRMLVENKLTMGHARALVGVENAVAIAQEIADKSLSVRQTEKLVRFGKEPSAYRQRKQREQEEQQRLAATGASQPAPQAVQQQPTPVAQPAPQQARPAHRDPDIMALEETLSENLGLKVSIDDRGQSGDITVSYESLEQLDDILRRLGGSI